MWFLSILLLGGVWIGYSLTSPRRNPPIKVCRKCDGDGVLPLWDGDTSSLVRTCVDCEGDGWVPA
jgi:DnaJ-class molecular chaperone